MPETPKIALQSLLRELNISLDRAIEFFDSKGHKDVPKDRNARISVDLRNLLVSEFSTDKDTKQKIDSQREKEKATKDTIKKEVAQKKEVENIDIVVEPLAQPKIVGKVDLSEKKPKKVAEKPVKPVAKVVEEKIVEEVKPIAKKVTKTTKTEAQPIEHISTHIPEVSAIKVLGKIDLTPKKSTKASVKETSSKKEEEEDLQKKKSKAVGKKKTEEITQSVSEPKEIIQPSVIEEKIITEVVISEDAKLEAKKLEKLAAEEENHIGLNVTKMDGPKVLGKIELPGAFERTKKPVASSNIKPNGGGFDKNDSKKKRQRIIGGQSFDKDRFDKAISDLNKQPEGNRPKPGEGNTGGNARFSEKEKFKNKPEKTGNNISFGVPPVVVPSLDASGKPKENKGKDRFRNENKSSSEQVNKHVKQTLAKLNGGGSGKSKSSKYRKQKREDGRVEREEQEQLENQSTEIKCTEFVSASELASLMNIQVTQVISTCMSLGLFVSINQRLDAETIVIVAEEFGYTVDFVSAEDQLKIVEEIDAEEDLLPRAPIVTVMGHVDHGKTSLLDYIRKANVIAGEAGGITQHIGAYSVKLDNDKRITFLDTPGHEAFTAMRARGAKVTDIAIIVIAADDSVMPQTIEAINHAQAANVPIVFAFNKMDKPGANAEKIREQLSAMNILVEEWGGKYQTQEIAAKKGMNIKELLDKVLLEAEFLNLKANPNKRAVGTIVEASMEKGKGKVANLLVEAGTLNIGDIILAGSFSGRVKAMFNERGTKIKQAGPATPVTILGIDGSPTAGDKFHVMVDEREARDIANKRQQLQREQKIRTTKHITLDEIGRRLAIGNFKELNLIIKGDVDGSVEALSDSLLKLSTDQIQVRIIHKGVGTINESDVLLASASDAIIIGFQVRPTPGAKKLIEQEEIDVRTYSIIYTAINEIKDAMEGLLGSYKEEKVVCNIEIRDVFKITKVGTIAGCYVLDGKVTRSTKVRVIRDGIVLHTGSLESLKRFKEDVKEVGTGYECGLNIAGFNDIKAGDLLEGFEEIEVKRKL